jgi:Ca2+/Na+ antiporter
LNNERLYILLNNNKPKIFVNLKGGYVNNFLIISSSLFCLAASCYLLLKITDPLEEIGVRIGRLLRLPESVIASTLQAFATSGGEITMAILAATPFISIRMFDALQTGEKACSGTLNMAFSAMDNLLGIGALAIIIMIVAEKVKKEALVPYRPSTIISLGFYIAASGMLAIFILDGTLSYIESWSLMGMGIFFILFQVLFPYTKWYQLFKDDEEEEEIEFVPHPKTELAEWTGSMVKNSFEYLFLLFGLVIFVMLCMMATFNLGKLGIVSIGGILLAVTSYVSSLPEFMLAFRFIIKDKKDELLAMLFGSNVIDLGFSGFRSIYLKEDMQVYTTGSFPELLVGYIWALPIVAILLMLGFLTHTFRWKHAKFLFIFYLFYIISGFILL